MEQHILENKLKELRETTKKTTKQIRELKDLAQQTLRETAELLESTIENAFRVKVKDNNTFALYSKYSSFPIQEFTEKDFSSILERTRLVSLLEKEGFDLILGLYLKELFKKNTLTYDFISKKASMQAKVDLDKSTIDIVKTQGSTTDHTIVVFESIEECVSRLCLLRDTFSLKGFYEGDKNGKL